MSKKSDKAKVISQYRIQRTDTSWSNQLEPVFETPTEAEVRIAELRRDAVAAQRAAEFRKEVGRPAYTDDYDLKAVAEFDQRKFKVVSEPMTSSIYRLNTLPSESSQLVREIMFKLRYFDAVELCWTCMGHTRAEWQGEASASWLRSHGFNATVAADGDVTISMGKEVA